MQLSLLPDAHNKPHIKGLVCIPEYITQETEVYLLGIIDSQPWSLELKRRTQHYGYKYDYAAREVSPGSYLGSLPDWLQELSHKPDTDKMFPEMPDQVIVNRLLA